MKLLLDLRAIEGHLLNWAYDIVVKLSGPSTKATEEYNYSKIRNIDGIKTTSTLLEYTNNEF